MIPGAGLQDLLQRAIYTGPDGSVRLLLRPGEGEYVCPVCDTIEIDRVKPNFCTNCGAEGMETLRPAYAGNAHAPDADNEKPP